MSLERMFKFLGKLNVYLINYRSGHNYCRTVVLAETYDEAKQILLKDYKKFGAFIEIEGYDEISEKGSIITERSID